MKERTVERTKEFVKEYIRTVAAQFGFKVVDNNWFIEGIEIVEETRTVNFTIHANLLDVDTENRKAKTKLEVGASIATMGGNPTGDCLIAMADVINRAGRFVNLLAKDEDALTYVHSW